MLGYPLKVLKKIKEATDAVSIQLEVPKDLQDVFVYKSGQFVGIQAEIGGEKVTRSYSLSSTPQESCLQITLKKLQKGKMSSYLVEEIKEGDILTVIPPEGQFAAHPEQKHHIMFVAGSGVAPIFSMIKSILLGQESDPPQKKSKVTLFYSNKSEEDTIFKSQLSELQDRFEELKIYWMYTQKDPKNPSLYKTHTLGDTKQEVSWHSGRINEKFLKHHFLWWQGSLQTVFYLCGPEDFMDFIQAFLGFSGYDHMQIRKESFGSKDSQISGGGDMVCVVGTNGQIERTSVSEKSYEECEKIVAEIDFEDCEVTPQAEESVLEALLRAGFDPPYSCLEGNCLACQCTVKEGAIRMRDTGMLNEDDYAEGRALSCQAIPLTKKVKVQYEF